MAIGGYLVTFSKRHPTVDRPLIDYETTLLMEPFALVGSVLGVFFNVAFPEYISNIPFPTSFSSSFPYIFMSSIRVLCLFLNLLFSFYVVLVCLVILLSVTAYKTFQKVTNFRLTLSLTFFLRDGQPTRKRRLQLHKSLLLRRRKQRIHINTIN